MQCQLTIPVCQKIILFVVDRIIRLHTIFILGAVLFGDNGLWAVIDFLTKHLKMFMFYDASIGLVMGGVVDNGIALIISTIFRLCFKPDRTPVQFAILIVEVLIQGTTINEFISILLPISVFRTEEIGVCQTLYAIQKTFNQLVVSSNRYSLVFIIGA